MVNTDYSEVYAILQNIKNALTSVKNTRASVNRKYQQIGSEWHGKEYINLGEVISECNQSLIYLERLLLAGENGINQLLKAIQDYKDVSINGTVSNSNNSFASNNDAASNGGTNPNELRSLSQTNQSMTNVMLDGRNCIVFDHPFNKNNQRICNQGSAYPTGPQNTCGCCSSGTIVNKAGGQTNEHDMVSLAWNNGLCDNDGFTTANTISDLLTISGVSASVTSGLRLDELANSVESGHGVIIAINARRFDPSFYRESGGHAVVLESVVRDASTNEILEYIVVDSNRENSISAVRRVEARQLENAFRDFGNQSITTDNIIW